MSITVFGSINMDLVARTSRLPLPGETVTGSNFFTTPGGKGANQAVACARLGFPTGMIGCVGDDEFGRSLLDSLRRSGVDTAGVAVGRGVSSGIAVITVDDEAENTIVIVSGANGQVGEEELRGLEIALERTDLLLLQLEIPMAAVVAAARLARQRDVPVILDPAPAMALPDELYTLVDILTPNTTEAAALVWWRVEDRDSAATAGRSLLARGVRRATIVKSGQQGAYVARVGGGQWYPAIPVEAVDTTAAGDAFNGALAVALAEGKPVEQAMHWALAGGACAVAGEGAQPSMPSRERLLELLAR